MASHHYRIDPNELMQKQRQFAALIEGRSMALVYFTFHPDRYFWRRETLPHEDPTGGNITLVVRAKGCGPDATVEVYIRGDINAVPNDETFLRLLWERIDAKAPRRPNILFSPDEHLELYRAAGIEPPPHAA